MRNKLEKLAADQVGFDPELDNNKTDIELIIEILESLIEKVESLTDHSHTIT